MLRRSARWLAAAAAIAVIAVGIYSWFAPWASAVTLGQVLEKLEKAETIHVSIRRNDGRGVDFWHTSQPNQSRWDERWGEYRIADGSSYWIVNENANEVRRRSYPKENSLITSWTFWRFRAIAPPQSRQPRGPNSWHCVRCRHSPMNELMTTTQTSRSIAPQCLRLRGSASLKPKSAPHLNGFFPSASRTQ